MKEIAISFDSNGSTLSSDEVTASLAIFYFKRYEGDFAIFKVFIRDWYLHVLSPNASRNNSLVKICLKNNTKVQHSPMN
jgi:hypothetical protein